MTEDRALEEAQGLLAATDRQQADLLRAIARAVAAPRPELVKLPPAEDMPDAAWNQELLSANADRLLSYLRNQQVALEARVWFARPNIGQTARLSREQEATLGALGDFAAQLAAAQQESLVRDLIALGFRDASGRLVPREEGGGAKRGLFGRR